MNTWFTIKTLKIDGILNIVELTNENQYAGFSTEYAISNKTAKTVCESMLYMKNREVRYRVVSSTFEDGSDVYSGWAFPFVQMYQRLHFSEDKGRCIVSHELVFTPKNILGWLTCRMFIKPQMKSVVSQSNRALSKYMDSL